VDGCGLCRYLELANGVPPRRAKAILVDLASALAEAHAKGYLHAGLMPSSVYIDVSQRPRISAFQFMNLAPDAGRWGTFLVNHETCTNLSPEQFYGHGRTQLSDQYALGLIGRELLTGKSIAPINCPADFVKRPQAFEALASEVIGGASTGLAGIVSRMLRIDPAERWASMQEVLEVLNDVVVYDTDTDRLRRKVVASYSELQIGDGGKRFYEAVYRHLFTLIPAARAYFSEEQLARQYAALNPALKLLLDYNPAKPQSVAAIREIARHHARLSLSGQHIDAFLKALLLALAEVGQAADLVEAWQHTMAPGLDEMRRVLDSDSAPQPLSGSGASHERTQSQLASA
jgi:serine/threonine protein kinase